MQCFTHYYWLRYCYCSFLLAEAEAGEEAGAPDTKADGSGDTSATSEKKSKPSTSAIILANAPVMGNAEDHTTFPSFNAANVDKDDDGLIEIYSIEILHNIRNDLYSDGSTSTNAGCNGASGGNCKGYELIRNLNFKTDSYSNKADYTTGIGWDPIRGNSSNVFYKYF